MIQSIRKRAQNSTTTPKKVAMDRQTHANPKTETTRLLSTDGSQGLDTSPLTNDDKCNTIYNVTTGIPASLYVISGVTQPLLMTICKAAGLADPNCQLYMLFYYLGPASVGLRMCLSAHECDTITVRICTCFLNGGLLPSFLLPLLLLISRFLFLFAVAVAVVVVVVVRPLSLFPSGSF